MKNFRKIVSSLTCALCVTGLALSFSACSKQTPFQADDSGQLNSASLAKEVVYPQFAAGTFDYMVSQGGYEGGTVNVPSGSFMKVIKGSLTPPVGTPFGGSVTITMLLEKDPVTNQLLFTFGPHGSQFNPPAEVWFDWSDLGSSNATLYYIDDNGEYIQQEPADVDTQGKRMKIYLDHFSRYAIGAE